MSEQYILLGLGIILFILIVKVMSIWVSDRRINDVMKNLNREPINSFHPDVLRSMRGKRKTWRD
jgi:hypothetical protein